MAEQPIKPEPQDGAPVDPEAPAAEAADGALPRPSSRKLLLRQALRP